MFYYLGFQIEFHTNMVNIFLNARIVSSPSIYFIICQFCETTELIHNKFSPKENESSKSIEILNITKKLTAKHRRHLSAGLYMFESNFDTVKLTVRSVILLIIYGHHKLNRSLIFIIGVIIFQKKYFVVF